MSTYEDYNTTSEFYDSGRRPVGSDLVKRIVIEASMERDVPVSRLRILDAGCGTGNYLKLLYDIGCRNMTGLEYNDGMLKQCKAKLEKYGMNKDVTLYQGSVLDLPFKNESFDIVFANQMLHHVDTDDTRQNKDHLNVKNAIGEFNRVLTKNGLLLINESSHQQINSYWYYDFIIQVSKKAKERLYSLFIDAPWAHRVLNEKGFRVSLYDLEDNFVHPPSLINNPKNVNDPKWRALDSIWASLNENQLNHVLKSINQAANNPEKWNQFMKKKNIMQQVFGKSTYYVGRKITDADTITSKL